MIIRALSFDGFLDISGPELLGAQYQRAVFRRSMVTGEVLEIPDEYLEFPNILNAVNAGLLEVLSYDSDDESLVINAELSGFSGAVGVAGTKFADLDFHGAADTALIREVDDVPYLEFRKNSDERSIWTKTVPEDYQSGDVFIEVYWSPRTSDAGNVRWVLEYKSVAPGASVAGASGTTALTQAASGTAAILQTTSTSLAIPASIIAVSDMLNISVNRLGKDGADTYDGTARVHLVRIRYTGLIFS